MQKAMEEKLKSKLDRLPETLKYKAIMDRALMKVRNYCKLICRW